MTTQRDYQYIRNFSDKELNEFLVKFFNSNEIYYLDWSVIMPLSTKYGISLLSYTQTNDPWIAQYQTFEPTLLIESKNLNPIRAIAECLALVLLFS
jgi:hypothetical protein